MATERRSPTGQPRLVARVDHLYARVPNPRALFEALTERLGLPRSYGYARVPLLEGGAVSIGDVVFLEALRYAPGRKVRPPAHPGLDGLALESGLPLADAATELSERGLVHSPPYTYSGDAEPFRFGEPLQRAGLRTSRGPLWSMVMIGGVLGERRLRRLRPVLPARGDSLAAKLVGRVTGRVMSSRRFGPPAVARSLGSHPTVWLHDFRAADMNVARAVAAEQLSSCSGGQLGVRRVREIVLAARDLAAERERWQRLLDPARARTDGTWELDDGPAVRLTEGKRDQVAALVCEVASVDAAAESLERLGMLATVDANQVRIAPGALQGVDIRLTQQAAAATVDKRPNGR